MSALHAAWALTVTAQVAMGQGPPGPPGTPVVFQAAHAPISSEPPAWIAPRELSAADGDWGVAFAPRYATLADAEHRRDLDLAALGEALRLNPRAHREAEREIAQREASVRAWLTRLEAEVQAATSADARRAASDRRLLLLAEASTLALQADLARGAAPRPTRDAAHRDRVSVGLDLVVPVGDTVRHALALGGDLRVEGTLSGDAIALGGKVVLAPGGVVEGRSLDTGAAAHAPNPAVVAALAAYGALVPLALRALAGAWVADAATHLRDRPLASARVGLGVAIGLCAWGLAAAGSPWAQPLAVASGASLFALTSLGLAAIVQANPRAPRWASALTIGAALAGTSLLPAPVFGLAAAGALPALGAVAVTGWSRLRG